MSKQKKAPAKISGTKGKEATKEPKTFADLNDADWKTLSQQSTLAWKTSYMATPAAVEVMLALNVDAIAPALQEKLGLQDVDTDMQASIKLDIYSQLLWMCQRREFTVLQTSAAFQLVDQLLSNITEKAMSLADNLDFFRTIIKDHATLEPWDGLGPIPDFCGDAASTITQYIKNTLFQHYSLYCFSLTATPQPMLGTVSLALLAPFAMPPMAEGVVVEELEHYERRTNDGL